MITNPVPDMTDPQYRALTAAVNAPDGIVRKQRGISTLTLRALTKVQYGGARWADPVSETTDERGVKVTRFVGVQIRDSGRAAQRLVAAQLDQVARNAQVRGPSLASRIADPFDLVRLAAPRELAIMF